MNLGWVFRNLSSEPIGDNGFFQGRTSKMVEERDKLGKESINKKWPGLEVFKKSVSPYSKRC